MRLERRVIEITVGGNPDVGHLEGCAGRWQIARQGVAVARAIHNCRNAAIRDELASGLRINIERLRALVEVLNEPAPLAELLRR